MQPINKNDIVIALSTIRTSDETWRKGTRFVSQTTTSAANTKVGLCVLDKNGVMTENGISLPLKELDSYFSRTTETHADTKAQAKPVVAPIKNNEILISKVKIHDFPVGTRFGSSTTTSSAKKKVQVFALNEQNQKGAQGFGLALEAIDKYFSRTSEMVAETTYKKGHVFKAKKSISLDYQGESVVIDKEVRALVIVGGANPTLIIAQAFDRCPIVTTATNFTMQDSFELAQEILDPKLSAYGVKNLQEIDGEETRCFTFDFTLNGKVVGFAQNNGKGGAHHVSFTDRADKQAFNDIVKHYAENYGESESLTQDHIVDYFLNGYHKGFITFAGHMRLLQEFLGASCSARG